MTRTARRVPAVRQRIFSRRAGEFRMRRRGKEAETSVVAPLCQETTKRNPHDPSQICRSCSMPVLRHTTAHTKKLRPGPQKNAQHPVIGRDFRLLFRRQTRNFFLRSQSRPLSSRAHFSVRHGGGPPRRRRISFPLRMPCVTALRMSPGSREVDHISASGCHRSLYANAPRGRVPSNDGKKGRVAHHAKFRYVTRTT